MGRKVRVQWSDEKRLVKVDEADDLDALKVRICEVFGSPAAPIRVKYVDEDGDEITMSMIEELHELDEKAYLYIVAAERSDAKPEPAGPDFLSALGLGDLLKVPAIAALIPAGLMAMAGGFQEPAVKALMNQAANAMRDPTVQTHVVKLLQQQRSQNRSSMASSLFSAMSNSEASSSTAPPNPMASFMSAMMGGQPPIRQQASIDSTLEDEAVLELLSMGFDDADRIRSALRKTGNDVSSAIDELSNE